ncbi:MAG: methyltransferase domain-containing protein [Candidatus Omnitrophota bacterium]|nr:methyltransferase domain-containing protein [Candidatus Omnitrophota bacterium]
MDKTLVEHNFSRNAAVYEDHASVQKRCAEMTAELLGGGKFERILEVGCGTGLYTRILRRRYPGAFIDAVDLSKSMVDIASRRTDDPLTDFHVLDGEYIPRKKSYDLITSNASFQWFQDLEGSLARFRGMMAGGGVLCFSIYGPGTFRELQEVLSEHFGRYIRLTSAAFPDGRTVENIIRKYFKRVRRKEEEFMPDFISLWDLLRDIKKSGARGNGIQGDIFLGKYTVKALEKAYVDRFKGIKATHQVSFFRAEK